MKTLSQAVITAALILVLGGTALTARAADTTAPGAAIDLGAFPTTKTATDVFTIFWDNPTDPSGIDAAWYKFDTAPTSPANGTRVAPVEDTTDPDGGLMTAIKTGAYAERTIFVWLEDGAGNKDHSTATSIVLRPEGALENIVRVAGADRFETAVETSKKVFPVDQSASAVVLANGLGFADALAGVPLAFSKDAPILLTRKNSMPQVTYDELVRVLPAGSTVYILGGTAAIDAGHESFLVSNGFIVKRLGGATRMETSVNIAEELDVTRGSAPTSVYIANGYKFADPLSISTIAAIQQRGVLLTEQGDLSQRLRDYINNNQATINTVTLIGGSSVIPQSIADLLSDAGYGVSRIGGNNRYHTSRLIADLLVGTSPASPVGIAIASGVTAADALPAGVHAAAQLYPLLLVPPTGNEFACTPTDTYDYMLDNAAVIEGGYLYGGTAAVGADVETFAESAIAGVGINCP